MSKNTMSIKQINGMDAEDYFGQIIGPVAATILEKCLLLFMETDGKGMTGPQMKLVQFAIEKSYGTAARQLTVTRTSDADILADDSLDGIDPDILRRIASTNAKRDDEDTIN